MLARAPQSDTRARTVGRWTVAAVVVPLVAGCSTVRGDANEVVIEHLAEQPGAAQILADEHCARYGKRAVHVQMGPTQSWYLWLRGKVSVFECRDPGPKPGKATP